MKKWNTILKAEAEEPYFKKIIEAVQEDAKSYEIYPAQPNIFTAFKLCPFDQTRVVILGQDPYHNPGQAHGLSFSVPPGVDVPPSLKNIFKELKDDLGIDPPNHGNLTSWAKQGVLLLNSALTVRKNEPASHKNVGWDRFTNQIITHLGDREDPIVFILWGNFARGKKIFIQGQNHLILEAAHPSPLSAYSGFFGSKPFSKTNEFLIKNHQTPINWRIENI